jgi:2-polyprenyl-3-methyl-5-hydroxy-6-metoxy-1,4-benzoquinol methylase
MKDWKQRLYDSYISSGQAGGYIDRKIGLDIQQYPQLSHIIKKHLPSKKDIAILDLACGHGSLVYCLKQHGYSNVQGVDISAEQVGLAHELGLTEVKCQDIKEFLLDKKDAFDVIFLMDILEHFTKQELFDYLDMIRQSLRQDGMVVIHVPNAEGIFGMRIRYGDLTHENCFTPQSINQALMACGFDGMICFEDKPIIHGLKSFIRSVLWKVLSLPLRLMLIAETGNTKMILSQNMLVVAKKLAR